ncbi:MAG: hypothetical protein COX44_00590 [Candidatus Portnoybacteria bacterium CG23_combo_of_CG06-09_8_20_14_all_37_13]|uniref:Uncharacterized protein n=1 Tax=Candidatus Portnoybacteria bacterium CG23_combo_of_CG06-09_8_20_14_all_37_13 TaxID=1974819 RepID=A0A2G9YDP7_9BACT|nr:MAG: hypothetical protein COX44_00590 [Candidatus Portnoybacteria bacterium CG23_combo_of_CG06-09_8_20_14_all_37_13]
MPPKKNLKLSKNAASPLAGKPQITGACFRRLRRRKMFELFSVYGVSQNVLANGNPLIQSGFLIMDKSQCIDLTRVYIDYIIQNV